MSSVDNEPRALSGIVNGCLQPVLDANTRVRDDVRLEHFNEEAFIRQSNRIPERLAEMVEEASGGSYTVRAANSAVADQGTVFNGESYFVRCASDTREGEVTHPTPDMVLFIINRYTKRLLINVPMKSQDDIDAEITRREQQRIADRETERIKAEDAAVRRAATEAENAQLMAAIEWHVEQSDNRDAKEKWKRMNSRHSAYHGAIVLPDLLDLCHLLGTNLAMLVITSPATAEATH